jgi:hypothetical protein
MPSPINFLKFFAEAAPLGCPPEKPKAHEQQVLGQHAACASMGRPLHGQVDCSEPTGIARILLIIARRGPEAALRATTQKGQRGRNKAASVVNPHARCYIEI